MLIAQWSAPTSGGRAKFLGRILGQKLVWGVRRSVVISVFTSGFAVPFCLTVPFHVVTLASPTTWSSKVLGKPRHQSPSNSIGLVRGLKPIGSIGFVGFAGFQFPSNAREIGVFGVAKPINSLGFVVISFAHWSISY